MLPGIRFLFAAVALAVSMLVFGLGAAALLRASHEQFANVMTTRPASVQLAARPAEPPIPTLSMLRVDPEPQPTNGPASEPAGSRQAAAPIDTNGETHHDEAKTGLAQMPESSANSVPEPAPPSADAEKPSQQAHLTLPARDDADVPPAQTTKPEQAALDAPAPPAAAPSEPQTSAPGIAAEAGAKAEVRPEPSKPDAAATEAAKAPEAAASNQPESAEATALPVQRQDVDALPQVAALTGRIPTPRRDPRAPSKPVASTSDQAASPESAQEQAAQPAAAETTSSITPPEANAEKASASKPKATKRQQVKRKVKRRRQSEVRQPRPVFARPAVAPMPPFGFPPT